MRNVLLAIFVATLPAAIAAAEQPGRQRPDQPPAQERLLPMKRSGAGNSCAAYGPGFVKIDGTGSCVKVGGAIEIGAGGSR
jgi:hypothetical protein